MNFYSSMFNLEVTVIFTFNFLDNLWFPQAAPERGFLNILYQKWSENSKKNKHLFQCLIFCCKVTKLALRRKYFPEYISNIFWAVISQNFYERGASRFKDFQVLRLVLAMLKNGTVVSRNSIMKHVKKLSQMIFLTKTWFKTTRGCNCFLK